MKRKVIPKLNVYRIISDAIENGLGFAMNRLQDHGVEISDEQREASLDQMLNEILIALEEVVEF